MDSIFMTMEDWLAEHTLNFGIFCLLPVIVILVIAVWRKTTFSALLAGVIVACLMVAKGNPLVTIGLFMDEFYITACDDGTMWVLLVCGLFGSLIALMTESGGVLGFTKIARKLLNSRNKTLIGTWILGIIIFVDDYLNCLAVGAATRSISDEHKISREMSACRFRMYRCLCISNLYNGIGTSVLGSAYYCRTCCNDNRCRPWKNHIKP